MDKKYLVESIKKLVRESNLKKRSLSEGTKKSYIATIKHSRTGEARTVKFQTSRSPKNEVKTKLLRPLEFLHSVKVNEEYERFLDEEKNISKYADAVMNGKNKVAGKTGIGVHNMMSNLKMHEHEVADYLMQGKSKLKTSFGDKTKEGVADMVKRHRDEGHSSLE